MKTTVIVVGAGPAGLMLSAELRLAGIDVVLLERLEVPTGESRGLGFLARTMEIFDQRGLLHRFGEIETSNVGHFGGLSMDFGVVPGAHFGGKGIPQSRTEEVLEEWASELGVDIRRAHEVTGFHDDGDGVDVDFRGPRGAGRVRARYLVGCDGGRSTVRKVAGFDFPGSAATMEMFIADITDCDVEPRWAGQICPTGMVMAGPLANGVTRIVVCERDKPAQKRTAPPPFSELADGWQRLTGEDIHGATPIWTSSFGNATRQVTQYRRGNVLLAGDAAHIHLPAGGQGMNTSIQDAVNLGWKLAAKVKGTAPDGLLDTYESERWPVGQRLLMNTRAQGLLFLSGESMQPLRNVMTSLMSRPEVSRHLVSLVSGLEIRYAVDPVASHPLLGMRMPPCQLTTNEGRSVNTTELLHSGRGVLLALDDRAGKRAVARGWADRIDVVNASVADADVPAALDGVFAALLRPDGYVAWVAPGRTDLVAALRRWFGSAVRGPAVAV
ncbi:monooxygenase (plasmid) [Pseudonocardia sp. EC080610-09]|uniref:FAD-dependent monooxygenase n=1 Tax=unclassified Pseudonocardia TaxID=2619320 RepID=UPI000706E491|nr:MULTISPECIES: FAD-dependent monooxygenase [unclassified Pseudonocardia]ALL79839.1 monooxygenase [Pseudonocardia sp. EC080610-09]ALL85782.1 monooxygenase [Pseudonocardia sp. EC080619-01]